MPCVQTPVLTRIHRWAPSYSPWLAVLTRRRRRAGDGTRTLTVQQYLEARATAGLVNR